MADNNDSKDEYQYNDEYTEVDPLNPHVADEEASAVHEGTPVVARSNVRRNALFAVALFILAIIIYKFAGPALEDRKMSVVKAPTTLTPPPPHPLSTTATPVPTTSTRSTSQAQDDDHTAKPTVLPTVGEGSVQSANIVQNKLISMEANQESMRTDLSGFHAQVVGMTSTIDALSTKVAELTATINALNEKLASRPAEVTQVTVKSAPRVVRAYRVKKVLRLPYFIQAVIPGRAWLVAANGSTLTVREGSAIPGYGIVKLIDPSQGRILTSSGRMIRFSQDDS